MTSIAGIHKPASENVDWITPKFIIDAVGPFDLDPCASPNQPWKCARRNIAPPADGLRAKWTGRVWCNPPYSIMARVWLGRMAAHGSGIALTFARTETAMFFESVWQRAHGVLFLQGRLCFYSSEGTRAEHNSGGPSCLISYSAADNKCLQRCKLPGFFIDLRKMR